MAASTPQQVATGQQLNAVATAWQMDPASGGKDAWGKEFVQGSAKIENVFGHLIVTQVRISNTNTANWLNINQGTHVVYHLPTNLSLGEKYTDAQVRNIFFNSRGNTITFRISRWVAGQPYTSNYKVQAVLDPHSRYNAGADTIEIYPSPP